MANPKVYNVPPAPNLPLAPSNYSMSHFDVLNNVLRLYFNRLSGVLAALFDINGGALLNTPHVAAVYEPSQYATAANTPTIVNWDVMTSGSGFTLNANNTATAEFTGIYKITYSLQFANTDNTQEIDAPVWLRINGNTATADVEDSATIFTIPKAKSALIASYVCGYSEVVFQLNAGDEVGLWWGTATRATSGGAKGVYIYGQAAQTTPMPYPATPSAIGSITFVSAVTA